MSASNIAVLIGRMVKDVDLKATSTINIGSFTLAVDRSRKVDGQPTADFINCKAFGKTAETIEKFFRKGNKIAITGHIQTGSYTNKDGQRVYTTDVIVDSFSFIESKSSQSAPEGGIEANIAMPVGQETIDGFMNIPEGIAEELPFT